MWANGGSRVNGFPSYVTLFRQTTLAQGRERRGGDFCFSIRPWSKMRFWQEGLLRLWTQILEAAALCHWDRGSGGVGESSDSPPLHLLQFWVLALHVEFGQALDEFSIGRWIPLALGPGEVSCVSSFIERIVLWASWGAALQKLHPGIQHKHVPNYKL